MGFIVIENGHLTSGTQWTLWTFNIWIYSYKKWDLIVIQWDIHGIYPLVNVYITIENGHRNSGWKPIENGDKTIVFCRFTRG